MGVCNLIIINIVKSDSILFSFVTGEIESNRVKEKLNDKYTVTNLSG